MAASGLSAAVPPWVRRNFGNLEGLRQFAVRCRRMENDDPEEVRLLNCFMHGMVPWSAVKPLWRESRLPDRVTRIRSRLPPGSKCRRCPLTQASCRDEMKRARGRHRAFRKCLGECSVRTLSPEAPGRG
jgi:hypothetical protein